MAGFMHPEPSRAYQAQALRHMRSRPVYARWPADLDAVLADTWRARLLNVNAWALAVAASRTPQPAQRPAGPRPSALTGELRTACVDLKRAAAGDRDD